MVYNGKPYTQSLKSHHSIRGTIICMGRRGGMKSPKSPLNIPKTSGTPIQIQTHILIELGLNIEILLWTQHQNIHRMPKKRCNFSQILLGRSMHVSKVSWGCGQSAAVKGKPNDPLNDNPNDPRNYSFPKVVVPALATTAPCENKSRDKCRRANVIELVNTSPNITNNYLLMSR